MDAAELMVIICAVIVILGGCIMHISYRKGGR